VCYSAYTKSKVRVTRQSAHTQREVSAIFRRYDTQFALSSSALQHVKKSQYSDYVRQTSCDVGSSWRVLIVSLLNVVHGYSVALKGPKLEIFGFRVFSQIRPVGVGDLGTRQKNSKF
jgi:hypothetical protein